MDTNDSTQADSIQRPPDPDLNWLSYFTRATLWFLAALVFYILATGPAVWLELKCPATKQTIDTIYLPLSHLCDRYPAIGNAFFWYATAVWRVPIPVSY